MYISLQIHRTYTHRSTVICQTLFQCIIASLLNSNISIGHLDKMCKHITQLAECNTHSDYRIQRSAGIVKHKHVGYLCGWDIICHTYMTILSVRRQSAVWHRSL